MTGIVNSTGAKSGIIGTTVGTPPEPVTGIANTNHLIANANVADDDFLRVDSTSIEGLTTTETKTALSLNNVDNDSTATIQAGTTKANVGLGNVDNVADASQNTVASYIQMGTSNAIKVHTNGWLYLTDENLVHYADPEASLAVRELYVGTTLTKPGGSFLIAHPLPSMKDTHNLIHSFTESPRADLIYRDKVALVDGTATVNIDTVAGMSEGTFVLLCDYVQCFTSNESDWDAVKGSVSGNILTIECENSNSTADVAWMVIADRQDDYMKDSKTTWTDDNGKPIIEPLKGVVGPGDSP